MTIEIYRKRNVFNSSVIDDEPECVFCDVSAIEITNKAIYGNVYGEQLTITLDHTNYHYVIV